MINKTKTTSTKGVILIEASAPKPRGLLARFSNSKRLKIEAYARLGRGTEHAKWNSSNIATLINSDKEDEYVLSVETTGAISPQQIILGGVEELSRRLEEFKQILSDLKSE
jgi:DNA-directed RNA polymerase subunit D